MLSKLVYHHRLPAAVARYGRSLLLRSSLSHQVMCSTSIPFLRAFSSNIGWSHEQQNPHSEPHLTIPGEGNEGIADMLQSTADMYENETAGGSSAKLLDKMEKKAAEVPSSSPRHYYPQTASDLLEDAYKRELSDPTGNGDEGLEEVVTKKMSGTAADKINLNSVYPDFTCTTTGSCTINYHSGVAVPPMPNDCIQGPCLDLGNDPCLSNVYNKWMVVEPIGMGCKYGKSCPIHGEKKK